MASSGIFQANKLTEILNQTAAPGFPLHWSSSKKQWYWSSNKRIPYYFYLSVIVRGSIILLQVSLLVFNHYQPGMLKLSQIVAIVLGILLTCSSLTFDIVILDDGPELIVACDWVYEKEDLIIDRKFGGNPMYGHIGYLIAIGFAVSITFTHVAILMFLVFAKMDPINVATTCFYPEIIQEQNIMRSLTLFRILFWLQVSLFCSVNLRTIFVLGMIQGFYRISILQIMTSKGPTKSMIKLYKESMIVLRIIHSFDYKATTVGYTDIFLIIWAAVTGAMIGLKRNKPMLIAISACMIVMSLTMLHFIFLVGCAFYALSKIILMKWHKEVGAMIGQRGYLKRVLRSLPVIAMPAGNIGIVDRDIKMNYLDGLLGYVVDGMMARNNR